MILQRSRDCKQFIFSIKKKHFISFLDRWQIPPPNSRVLFNINTADKLHQIMHLLLAMEQRPAFVQPMFVLSGFLVTLSGAAHIKISKRAVKCWIWKYSPDSQKYQEGHRRNDKLRQIQKNNEQGLGTSFCSMYGRFLSCPQKSCKIFVALKIGCWLNWGSSFTY